MGCWQVNEFQSIEHFDSPQFASGPEVLSSTSQRPAASLDPCYCVNRQFDALMASQVIAFYEMDGMEIWKDLVVLMGYCATFQLLYMAILQFGHTGRW